MIMLPVEALKVIQYIEASKKKPGAWEQGFLTSVKKKALRGWLLTGKECDKLFEIYSRVYGGGQYQSKEYI